MSGRARTSPPVTITFLGTCAGSGPSTGRNCSSLAVGFGNETWLFDAADGTVPRMLQAEIKTTSITRIFITHMHADHVLGVTESLLAALGPPGPGPTPAAQAPRKERPKVEVYGPRGLRRLIRTSLEITRPGSLESTNYFSVHEILLPGESASAGENPEILSGPLANEVQGKDIYPGDDGVWKSLVEEGSGASGKGWAVHAGPIEHRVSSLGYILQEPTPRSPLDTSRLIPLLHSNASALAALDPPIRHPLSLLSHLTSLPPPPPYTLPSGDVLHPPEPSGIPPRKVVILGDCTGGTKNSVFEDMCLDASLLVHECTRAAIPESVQSTKKGKAKLTGGATVEEMKAFEREKREEAQTKALARGHSSPVEVAEFAAKISPRRLVLNHFSVMFNSPHYPSYHPLPPILSAVSPYPAYHALESSETLTLPLSRSELQDRLTMQSIADQVRGLWTMARPTLREVPGTEETRPKSEGDDKVIIPARDFMRIRLTSHDLSAEEKEEFDHHQEGLRRVMAEWRDESGVWVGEGDQRRFLAKE